MREEVRKETVRTEEVAPIEQEAINEEDDSIEKEIKNYKESGQVIGPDILGGLDNLETSLEANGESGIRSLHL